MLLFSAFVSACIVFAILASIMWIWAKAFDFMANHGWGDLFFFGTIIAMMTLMFYTGDK